eukprot:3627199-Amphidinium_carterae.1
MRRFAEAKAQKLPWTWASTTRFVLYGEEPGALPEPGLGVPARGDAPEGEQVRPADAGALLGETPIVPAETSLPEASSALEELPDLPDLESEEQKEPTPLDTLSVFHDALEHPDGLDSRPVDPTETREPRDIKSDGDVSS